MAAVPAGKRHRALADGEHRRAPGGAEIDPRMHPRIAENRVIAHAVAGCLAAGDRCEQSCRIGHRLAGLARVEERAARVAGRIAAAPAHQLGQRLAAALEPGKQQRAGFSVASRRALVGDDQIETVGRRYVALEAEMAVECLQVLLDRLDRGAGGPGRTVQAGADRSLNAQRRRIDRDRAGSKRQRAVAAGKSQIEVEAGAEGRDARADELRRSSAACPASPRSARRGSARRAALARRPDRLRARHPRDRRRRAAACGRSCRPGPEWQSAGQWRARAHWPLRRRAPWGPCAGRFRRLAPAA